jgi:hypothetical protein
MPQAAAVAAPGFVHASELDGVPLFFARGVPPRPQAFSIEREFHSVLLDTVRVVRSRAPRAFGVLERITTAGALVSKPGFHGLGRAFDHDVWAFEHVIISPLRGDHASRVKSRRQRYWALAALMRSQSAFVLHGEYNAAHRDHLHQDNGGGRAFSTSSEATVKLVQAVCAHVYGHELLIDGDFGPARRAAVALSMGEAGVAGDIFEPGQFKRFLLRSGRVGFHRSIEAHA